MWVSTDLDNYGDDKFVRKWGEFWSLLPFVSDDRYTTYAAWSVAREMHTPNDISDAHPRESDQPYAGVLYVDSLLYARSGRWAHAWELKLGTAGLSSQADDTQKWFHDRIGADDSLSSAIPRSASPSGAAASCCVSPERSRPTRSRGSSKALSSGH